MITVSIIGDFKGFEIEGHSGYAEEGSDIICATVSSAAYLTANTITDAFGLNADIKVDDGYMSFAVTEDNDSAKKLIKGFSMHVQQLADQYPEFVIKLN